MGLSTRSKAGLFVATEIFTILCGIASIITAANSYYQIKWAQSSMGEITTNWDTKPITGVNLVSWGTACPDGYSTEGTVMEWPGKREECGCQSGAKYKGKTQCFPWLFVDFETAVQTAKSVKFNVEVLERARNGHFLLRLSKL
jgi:hypothetical protein